MLRRGALIVFEGCDRVGKSTHTKLLSDALKEDDIKVETLQFPDRSTVIGGIINKYLTGSEEIEDHAVHLLFSANRWEAVPKMLQLLNSGVNLIVDRYAYSGVAFSYAKKGLSFSWCKQSDVGLPKPDLVLYLDLPSEAMAKRSGFGEERYEKGDFQNEVKKVYGLLREDNWKVISTDRELSEVQEEIKTLVKQTINNSARSTYDTLWTDNFETYV
ncbi:thymidylate kinase [Parasteatoda tepidariorum]|uniref:thymidylate kinase n=1 Tax=Parasteatoda tepidariorum TaxID=114398 RepID=UPI00077FA931|nr:thymidylate kinase [Parasteatoda tepidariorum]XP_042897047.1 thymidylate kinase [Parasteatoda tepidariorum]